MRTYHYNYITRNPQKEVGQFEMLGARQKSHSILMSYEQRDMEKWLIQQLLDMTALQQAHNLNLEALLSSGNQAIKQTI